MLKICPNGVDLILVGSLGHFIVNRRGNARHKWGGQISVVVLFHIAIDEPVSPEVCGTVGIASVIENYGGQRSSCGLARFEIGIKGLLSAGICGHAVVIVKIGLPYSRPAGYHKGSLVAVFKVVIGECSLGRTAVLGSKCTGIPVVQIDGLRYKGCEGTAVAVI